MQKKTLNPSVFSSFVTHWLGNDTLLLMDWDARAMHMHLMCIAWLQQEPCTLPNEDDLLRKWCGNPPDWERLKIQIFRAWKLEKERWIQKELLQIFQQVSKLSEVRKKAALKRWSKHEKKKKSNYNTSKDALHMQSRCKPLSSPNRDNKYKLNNNKKYKTKTLAPEEFEVNEEMRDWASKHQVTDLESKTERFLDYHRARSHQFSDWIAAWRNWMRKSLEFERTSQFSNHQNSPTFSHQSVPVETGKYDHLYE